MKLNNPNDREIVLVSGNLCSGKGTYCQTNFPGYHHITISNIVRSLINATTRSSFSTTKHLDVKIADELIKQIAPYQKVVVDGIRQLSIIEDVQLVYGNQIKDIIWLDVPDEVAKQRFTTRASDKDDQTYDQARAGDRNLGIEDVENYIRTNYKVVST